MKNFKLLALSTTLVLSASALALNKIDTKESICFKQEINSTSGYSFEKSSDKQIKMCISHDKSSREYLISENSFVYGDNKYDISGFEDKDFSNIESIQNLNGKLVIKTKSKKIYTGDIGYVLTNKEYLPLKRNNKITLKKEEISNVDKIIYSGDLIVFTQDKKVFMKSKNTWQEMPLKDVIDVTQSRFGSYFILTKTGVFAYLQDSDNRTVDPRERAIFYRFDKANLATFPVNDLRFRFVENDKNYSFRLIMDNTNNKRETFYVYFSVNKALITKDGKVREEKGLEPTELLPNYTSYNKTRITSANDIAIENIDKSIYGSFKAPHLSTNNISTKYNGLIELKHKETLALLSFPLNEGKYSNYKDIVRIMEDEEGKNVYILRSNGLLHVFDKETYVLQKRLMNVKSIELDSRGNIDIIK